jgi:predicted amidohydrolase YtcJ
MRFSNRGVLLDRNPLAVAPGEIRDIAAIETIVGEQTLYRK